MVLWPNPVGFFLYSYILTWRPWKNGCALSQNEAALSHNSSLPECRGLAFEDHPIPKARFLVNFISKRKLLISESPALRSQYFFYFFRKHPEQGLGAWQAPTVLTSAIPAMGKSPSHFEKRHSSTVGLAVASFCKICLPPKIAFRCQSFVRRT